MRHTLLAVAWLALAGLATAADAPATLRALQRYPALDDYFPYGFWMPDAPHTIELANGLGESYEARREKIFEDFARHHLNAVFPSNRAMSRGYLDVAQRYGLRAATMPNLMYEHVDGAGKLGPKDLEWVKAAWKGHAETLREHPALLAYHVMDEPHPTLSPKIQEVIEALALVDPRHPAIYTQQNLPLNRDAPGWGAVEWKLLEALDVILSDCYSIHPIWGRDPWIYGDVAIAANLSRPNPDALQWPVIQTFSYGATPTLPEVRVMVWHTIACGAKGMFFFTNETSYARWINPFYPAVGNPWFAEEPLYAEIGRMGRHLTSAGPLLIPRRLDPAYPVQVDTPSFRATVRTGWLRSNGDLTLPAIHVGAYAGQGADVLVIHNDDPWETRQGRVTITGRGLRVYDLDALSPVQASAAPEGAVSFDVQFQPGDGRLYLLGDEAAFGLARDCVLRHRYEQDSLMVRLDAEVALKSGVTVAPAGQLLEQAATAAAARDYAGALKLAGEARADLSRAQAADGNYARTVAALNRTRTDLHRIDDWCEVHPDFLVGSLGDARLKATIEQVGACSGRFARLENEQRGGLCRPAEAETLRDEVAALADQVEAYRPAALQSQRIGLIQLGEESQDLRALQDWLAMVYQQVDRLLPDGKGGFVSPQGAPGAVGSYDLLWIHLGDPVAPVRATYCGEAAIRRDAIAAATTTGLRAYVDAGGGLVLSGLAAALVGDLDYETSGPNELYWGPLAVPGGASMAWNTFSQCGKVLGLKPTLPEHALFRGLGPGGFAIWEWSLSERVGKAVWRKPAWPTQGTVLAGYYSDGATIPDEFAVVVEYTGKQGGRVVVVGDGLDPARDGAYDQGKRWGTTQDRFIRNLVEYCARGVMPARP